MFKHWFRPDVEDLEKRVAALEKTLVMLYNYLDYHIKRNDANVLQLDTNMVRMAQAIVETIRPFPGQHPGSTQN
jgi:hypothetical protein